MLQKIALSSVLALCCTFSFAQKYTTAVGARLGSGVGLSVQQHVLGSFTVEGIAQKNLFRSGTNVSVLLEHHQKIAFKSFNFYVGGGPHVEFKPATTLYDQKGNSYTANNNGYGISAIAGLELRLNKLLLSYDYQPGINFHGGDHIFNSQTSLSVRYILFKPAKKKKDADWMFWKKWGNGQKDSKKQK